MASPGIRACPSEAETTTSEPTTTTTAYRSWNNWNSYASTSPKNGLAKINETDKWLEIEVTEADAGYWSSVNSKNKLKVTKDADNTIRITIDANGGNRRLLLSQKSGHIRWMRIHCKYCGAWIDIVENCAQRVVHFSTDKTNTLSGTATGNPWSTNYVHTPVVKDEDTSAVLPGGAKPEDYPDDEEEESQSTTSTTTTSSYWSYRYTQPVQKPKLVVKFASNCKQDVRNVVVEQFHRLGLEPPPELDEEEILSSTTEMATTKKQKLRRGDVLVPKGQFYNRKVWFANSESKSEE
uniref:Uncharacterized protein n=1 Tax=Ditylenchus dipsaci TaxID=166011 RepID=A0A915EQH4_9BILA